jgi:hypothetical protein
MSAYIGAFMTGDHVTAESAASGDVAESGYIDPNWSRTTIQDRNNAGPLFWVREDDDELPQLVREALAELHMPDDNHDGTFYGQGEEQDPETGDYFTYAVHFVRKSIDASGAHVERPWIPSDSILRDES